MTLGWYNGWSGEERRTTIPIQAAARRDGRLPVCRTCCLCDRRDEIGNKYGLTLHNERYDVPLEGYPLCRLCHRLVHLRFGDPGRWLRYLARLRNVPRWARLVSLDPLTQYRPFWLTYPHGLPLPDPPSGA